MGHAAHFGECFGPVGDEIYNEGRSNDVERGIGAAAGAKMLEFCRFEIADRFCRTRYS
jgi:hypothetical protein